MIQRISLALIVPMCIIALFLALNGVNRIAFDDSYYAFMSNVARKFDSWSFTIPSINKIDLLPKSSVGDRNGVLEFLKSIANFFVNLANLFIGTLNIFIGVVNTLIHVVQFIITIVNELKDFIISNTGSAYFNGNFV